MELTHNGADFEGLDITDDFMFGTVFQDAGPLVRAGIVDLFVRDAEGNTFDVEMQNEVGPSLALRARRYLSLVDLMTLDRGAAFSETRGAVVIFICSSDPFGRGWKRYNFPRVCMQDGKELGNRSEIVFVNAKGTRGEFGAGLDAFLQYLSDNRIVESDYVRRVDKAVRMYRDSPLWRRSRVLWSEKYRDDFARARLEGQEEGEAKQLEELSQLAHRLEKAGRSDELTGALRDSATRLRLLQEFGIQR